MKKFAIVYPAAADPTERKAAEILTQCLLDYTLEYPVCVSADCADTGAFRCLFIGTKEDNPYLAKENVPHKPEAYSIRVQNDTVYITGSDSRGVLYGCVDFYNKYVVRFEFTHESGNYYRNIFDGVLPDFAFTSAPSVQYRGIWTWGHVIYDYRGFIDALVRLKMNSVIIWNDHPPMNAREMIACAHECGVRVIWGYPWFWDTRCDEIDIEKAYESGDAILQQYEKQYRDLGVDGIYFQSFTELHQETIGGVLIAEAVTEFVNRTAAKFLDKYPELELQFGLHATSVFERLEYIRRTDPRIRIVWEDCGAFPFSYIPEDVGNYAETEAFLSRITRLRGEDERFGAVFKGLTKLKWSEFEHPAGPMYIGTSSAQMQENRILRKKKIWRYLQAHWLINADKALAMTAQIVRETGGGTDIHALVEDGMLEKQIPYPVALLAEILWDCGGDLREMMSQTALRNWVDFM